MRKRVTARYSEGGGWDVDLPTYCTIAGTWLPITEGLITAAGPTSKAHPEHLGGVVPTVVVEIPDAWPLTDDGQLDAPALRAMYRDHRTFRDRSWYPPPISDVD